MKLSSVLLTLLLAPAALVHAHGGDGDGGKYFQRIASFAICEELDPTCNTDEVAVAEIVTASADGFKLLYTNSEGGTLGFVDITDPHRPMAAGSINVGGEPTSVAVCGAYAIVVVNTSADYVNTSGIFHVIDVASQTVLRTGDLPGQPDSVGIAPDCSTAAVAIENERDEDLGSGEPPQMPAGSVVIIDTSSSNVNDWSLRNIDLTGLDGVLYPEDPEPEFVSINNDFIAVVTLQENNGIVLVNTKTGRVINSYSAGSVDLTGIDLEEDGIISQTQDQANRPREPDGVVWIDDYFYATANEGDLNGGSRGFSIFDRWGGLAFDSGSEMDYVTAMLGHYPDERSGNKGNEPENVAFAQFGKDKLLFVNSERSSLVFVYDVKKLSKPELIQVLPAGTAPEGSYAIPSRNLFVVASESDSRGDKTRSIINIYSKDFDETTYPQIVSAKREDGTPIPFSALSALAATRCDAENGKDKGSRLLKVGNQGGAKKGGMKGMGGMKGGMKGMGGMKGGNKGMGGKKGGMKGMGGKKGMKGMKKGKKGGDKCNPNILYTIEDSFYNSNRIMAIDTSYSPPVIVAEMRINDGKGVFAAALEASGLGGAIESLINDDMTVNIDPEGIDVSEMGGFWLAHEGSGTVGDEDRPFASPNVLFKLDDTACIEEVILLPEEVNAIQARYGFEGVAEDGDFVVVTFQRAWQGEDHPRIGVYDTVYGEWSFVYYPLDSPESQNGGWVGLSDITSLGGGEFLILERDNQGGPDAAIKRIYKIDMNESVQEFEVISKELVLDLMYTLKTATYGPIVEKVEGLAITSDGTVWVNNDNDGVDDNSGENLLIDVGTYYY